MSGKAEEKTRNAVMSFVVDARGHTNIEFCARAVVKPQMDECLEPVEIQSHLYTVFLGCRK